MYAGSMPPYVQKCMKRINVMKMHEVQGKKVRVPGKDILLYFSVIATQYELRTV